MIANATIRYFGDYLLLDELAQGGMGIVYRARQISLGREVAVKLIRAEHLASPTFIQRFHVEAEAMAQLDHPHIVPIYEVGQFQGQHFLSMKLAEEGSLADLLSEGRSTPNAVIDRCPPVKGVTEEDRRRHEPGLQLRSPRDVASLIAQIARAVHHAHQRGVIHRDLKPANVLLDGHYQPLVADFGLAKLIDSELGLTQTSASMGTPHYMAPEQAAGQTAQITTAADVYGLGAVLFELLAGKPPFHAETRDALIRKVIHETPPRPQSIRSDVPRDLQTICLRCLEKDPRHRYRTAEELAEDLEAWMGGRPIAARPTGVGERLLKWVRRKPALAALIVVGWLGIGGVIWQWYEAEQARRLADDSLAQLRDAVTQYLAVIAANPRNKPTDPSFLREELLQTTVAFLEGVTRDRSADPALERQRGLAYLALCRIKTARREIEPAITNGLQGRSILAALSEVDPKSVPLSSDVAAADLALGGVLIFGGNLERAEECLLRALSRWQQLTNVSPVSNNARRQLATTCNRLCDVYRRQNRPNDAIQIQRHGLAVREGFVAEFPNLWDEKLNVAIDYNALGLALATAPVASADRASAMARERTVKLSRDPDRIRESQIAYGKAITTYQELVNQRPNDEAARSSLALSAWSFGNMLGALGEPTRGLHYLELALTNYQELVLQFPQKIGYQREVENTRGKIARLREPGAAK